MLLRFRKRFIPIIIIIMMIFSACSSNSEERSEQTDPGPAEERTQDQDMNTDEAQEAAEPDGSLLGLVGSAAERGRILWGGLCIS